MKPIGLCEEKFLHYIYICKLYSSGTTGYGMKTKDLQLNHELFKDNIAGSTGTPIKFVIPWEFLT